MEVGGATGAELGAGVASGTRAEVGAEVGTEVGAEVGTEVGESTGSEVASEAVFDSNSIFCLFFLSRNLSADCRISFSSPLKDSASLQFCSSMSGFA